MKKIVISQPMFFPWIGLFEQIKLSDIFVHYDDVQLPMGRSFTNRVQIKTKDKIVWLTVPLDRGNSKKRINEVKIKYDENWQQKHLNLLRHNYAYSEYKNDLLDLVSTVYNKKFELISDLNIFAIELITDYFMIEKEFYKSSELNIPGSSSERLLNIVKKLEGDTYITGLGALNYINYDLFENNNIKINYMDYKKIQYPQKYGDFTPYVSILDLIANCGKNGKIFLVSKAIYWKDFIKNNTKK